MIKGAVKLASKPEDDGKYLLVWMHDGALWSYSIMIDDGLWYMYSHHTDGWESEFGLPSNETEIHYFTVIE